jgi:putative glutamine amidotransferase
MQLINIIHQGTLVQDLGNKDLNRTHKGEPDKSHEVIIKENTLLSDIIPAGTTVVNSAHHQAVDKLGEGLVVNAQSSEGLVEGVERNVTGEPFLMAIQWHPERMFRFNLQTSPASLALRNRFIQEIKTSIDNKK